MKKLFTLLSVFLSILFTGCKTPDDGIITLSENMLGNSWSLQRVSGGLAGINITYSMGEVTWTFDESTLELHVQNNIVTTGPEDIYAGYETGVYSYEIQNDNGNDILFIDNLERGIITFNNNTLHIDDGVAADGMLTEFQQVNP